MYCACASVHRLVWSLFFLWNLRKLLRAEGLKVFCRRYLMMGLLDLEKVISLTGFKSHVLHNLDHRH